MYPLYNNPYQFNQPLNTPQIPLAQNNTNQIQYVNGRSSVDMFQMNPNESVLLMDSTQDVFYIKKTDASGLATVRTFRFEEVLENDKSAQYVTREEFEKFKAELKEDE